MYSINEVVSFTVIISLILHLSNCRSDFIAVENTTSIYTSESSTMFFQYNENVEFSTSITDSDDFPLDCSQRQKYNTLYKNKNSRLKKCCPIGESLALDEDVERFALCGSANLQLKPNLLNVTLYDNCIEDMETDFTLPIEIGNPCNTSILYNNIDDLFFIVQDGSLLVMDFYANDTFTLYQKYCVDISNISGITYAIVCLTSVEEYIDRSQIVVVATLMLISIPCLLFVSYLNVRIKELRSLHGIILSCMSGCLAIGNLLFSVVNIFNLDGASTGYAVQFFVLSYYFWFFCLCCNVVVNIWIHILKKIRKTKFSTTIYFAAYSITSFMGPATLAVLTLQKGLPGMPSYFMQGYTESIREAQRYFIPPVSSIILLSFIMLIATYFGFQRFKGQLINVDENEIFFGEVRKDAKFVTFLGMIILSTWLLEIITFYSPGPKLYLFLMDMINGLQGVFVLLIFLVTLHRRTIIFRWWIDRGSYSIKNNEMDLLNSGTQL